MLCGQTLDDYDFETSSSKIEIINHMLMCLLYFILPSVFSCLCLRVGRATLKCSFTKEIINYMLVFVLYVLLPLVLSLFVSDCRVTLKCSTIKKDYK